MKNIQKVVYDFREQRKILNQSRLQLSAVTGKLDDEKKQPAFAGMLQAPPPAPDPPDDQKTKAGRQEEKRRTMAAEMLTSGGGLGFGR